MKKKNTMRCLTRLVTFLALIVFLTVSLGCGAGKNGSSSGSGAPSVSRQESQKKPDGKKKQETPKQSETAQSSGKKEYSIKDIRGLRNTKNFSRNGLEHIFDGTINKKGKATGYHYSMIPDSKGRILDGTRSKKDANQIFTAKVEVDGVRKDGFSSFYPETWSPQEVVDAINVAYEDAINDPKNPRGSLWIGHAGKLEINMYLDDNRKILTAFPIMQEKKR